jgi:hypothetical protein
VHAFIADGGRMPLPINIAAERARHD